LYVIQCFTGSQCNSHSSGAASVRPPRLQVDPGSCNSHIGLYSHSTAKYILYGTRQATRVSIIERAVQFGAGQKTRMRLRLPSTTTAMPSRRAVQVTSEVAFLPAHWTNTDSIHRRQRSQPQHRTLFPVRDYERRL